MHILDGNGTVGITFGPMGWWAHGSHHFPRRAGAGVNMAVVGGRAVRGAGRRGGQSGSPSEATGPVHCLPEVAFRTPSRFFASTGSRDPLGSPSSGGKAALFVMSGKQGGAGAGASGLIGIRDGKIAVIAYDVISSGMGGGTHYNQPWFRGGDRVRKRCGWLDRLREISCGRHSAIFEIQCVLRRRK
jgi:hypothetical protein